MQPTDHYESRVDYHFLAIEDADPVILNDPKLKSGVRIGMTGREAEKLPSIFAAPKLMNLSGLHKVQFQAVSSVDHLMLHTFCRSRLRLRLVSARYRM